MKKRRSVGIWLVLMGILTTWPLARADSAEQMKALTLADCYRMALKQSEEIAIDAELLNETEGRFMQSLSGILPHVSFSSSDKRQDGSGSSAFTLKNVPERKFTFSQPLFSGFKEFAAMRGARLERHEREYEKARAEQLLLVDVSDAYHFLLEQREDLRVLDSIRKILRDRIGELEARERLGRSRSSELVAVQAQLYRVEAEWEQAQSRETITAQLVEFLTGLDAIGDLADPGPNLPTADPEEMLLAKADSRADVKALEQTLGITQQQLKAAKAKFFPTVGLDGNYYVERAGASKDVTWDASLKVDVPIFQGGNAVGATKEATSGVKQAELRLRQRRRMARQEIRDAYTEYDAALAQLRAFTKALEATEESYQLQVHEYLLNLVSNLEVLQSLQTLQDSRREVIHARHEALRRYWKLKSAAGETLS